MPVREADAEGAMRDDLRHGQVRRVDVEVALDDLQVRRDAAEEVVGRRVGEVAQAEDLADFAGGEEFFELCGGAGEVRRGTGGGIGGRGGEGGVGRPLRGCPAGCGSVWVRGSEEGVDGTGARSGMKRSPRTRTSLEVMVAALFAHGAVFTFWERR